MTDPTDSAPDEGRPEGLDAPEAGMPVDRDLVADAALISGVLDGEGTAGERETVEADPVLRALRDELDAARRAVAEDPPPPAEAVREVHLSAALAAFDEIHHPSDTPTVLPTIGPEAPDAPTVIPIDRAGRWRQRALAPVGVAAAVVLLIAVFAVGGVFSDGDDDVASDTTADDAGDLRAERFEEVGQAAEADSADDADSAGAATAGSLDDADSGGDGAADSTEEAGGEPTIDSAGGDTPAPATSRADSDRPRFDRQGDVLDYAEAEAEAGPVEDPSRPDRICGAAIDATTDPDDAVVLARAIVYLERDTELVVIDRADGPLEVIAYDEAGCDELFRRTL